MSKSKGAEAQKEAVKSAARALSDLNVLYAVIALMDGSLLTAKRYVSAQRIIAICKNCSEQCLRDYDAAVARATKESA